MATNTFTRSAGDLTRNTPAGYRKIDGSIYNAPVQGGGYYSGPESGAPTIDQSAVQPAAGGIDSPMLPSGGASVASDPMDAFNKLSLGLLNSAKGLTTADLLKKRRLLERASIDRSTAITPQDEQVLSPSQQESIRSGRVGALSSEIDANAYELEKAQQSVDNFFKVFESAQKISKDFADKMQAPDSVIENAKKIIEADSSKLATVLAGFNDKSKQAILGSLDYSQMKDPNADLDRRYKEAQIASLEQKTTPTGYTGSYVVGQNPTADAWVNRINNGQAKLSDITGNAALKNLVVRGLDASTGGKLGAVQTNLKEAKKLVDELITHPGRQAATGVPNLLTNPLGFSLPSSNARDFKAKVERLNALLFLNAVPQMKGMGQLTEREGARLESSSSITRELGVDEKTYLTELERLSKNLDTSNTNLGGDAVTVRMSGPKGTFDVPSDKVEEFKQNGYQTI